MIFIVLTFLAAFLIEGLGTATSVIGLSSLFGANPIIIALAIALDLGKIVVVSLLYTYWQKLGKIMKSYALMAAFITMVITSAGAGGYLMGEFQKAIIGTQEGGLKVEVLKTEQAKLEDRKKQIDDQIAKLPEKYSATQRIRMINQFKDEQKQVTARLMDISKELPELQVKQIGTEAKAGPILTIAKSFDIPVESAIKYVILMIIFVFDPLAVFLIIAGNFLIDHRNRSKLPPAPTPSPLKDEPIDNSDLNELLEDAIVAATAPEPLTIKQEYIRQIKEEIEAKPIPVPESLPEPEPVKVEYDEMSPRIIDLVPSVEPLPEPIEVPEHAPIVAEPPTELKLTRKEITFDDLAPRQKITLDQLQPRERATLEDASDDAQVTFMNPAVASARTVYQGQKR